MYCQALRPVHSPVLRQQLPADRRLLLLLDGSRDVRRRRRLVGGAGGSRCAVLPLSSGLEPLPLSGRRRFRQARRVSTSHPLLSLSLLRVIIVIVIIIIIATTMFMVLSSCPKSRQSTPGSFDECRLSAGWPPTLRPSQSTWAVSQPQTGSYHPHPPSPLLLLLSRRLILILPSHGGWKAEST